MRMDEPESRKYQKTDYYIDDFTERWLKLQKMFRKLGNKPRKLKKPYEIRHSSSAAWIVPRRRHEDQ